MRASWIDRAIVVTSAVLLALTLLVGVVVVSLAAYGLWGRHVSLLPAAGVSP